MKPPGSAVKACSGTTWPSAHRCSTGKGQSTTAAASPTEPFVCLGFARYAGHEGERILFVHQ